MPQSKDVVVYRIIMETVTDIFLNVLSFTKAQVLTAFLTTSENMSKSADHPVAMWLIYLV